MKKIQLKSAIEFGVAVASILGALVTLPLVLAVLAVLAIVLWFVYSVIPWVHPTWKSSPTTASATHFRRAVIFAHRSVLTALIGIGVLVVSGTIIIRFGPAWVSQRVHDAYHDADAAQRWIPVDLRTRALKPPPTLMSDSVPHTYAIVRHQTRSHLRELDVAIKEAFSSIPGSLATVGGAALLLAVVVVVVLYYIEQLGDSKYPELTT